MRDLNSLIGSRICHDLISPIGAISNGVELLTLTGGPSGPEIDMIAQSVDNANARIRFFRLAFGAAPDGARTSRTEVTGLFGDISRTGRVRFGWSAASEVPRRDAKLALLLVLCAESAMARGGTVEVAEADGSWSILAEGDRMRFTPAHWALLNDPTLDADVDAAHVQFVLAGEAARAAGRQIRAEQDEGQIRLTF